MIFKKHAYRVYRRCARIVTDILYDSTRSNIDESQKSLFGRSIYNDRSPSKHRSSRVD